MQCGGCHDYPSQDRANSGAYRAAEADLLLLHILRTIERELKARLSFSGHGAVAIHGR